MQFVLKDDVVENIKEDIDLLKVICQTTNRNPESAFRKAKADDNKLLSINTLMAISRKLKRPIEDLITEKQPTVAA